MKSFVYPTIAALLMAMGCGRDTTKKEREGDSTALSAEETVESNEAGLGIVDGPLVNLALGKRAYQSSDAWGAPASRAIDGNTDGNFWAGSVTHTAFQAEPFLEIDLGADMVVTKVTVFNRTDCCKERLDNYELSLRNSGQQLVHSERKRVVPRPSDNINFSNKVARYVRIQLKEQMNYLSLAEVQVWGYANPTGKLLRAFNNMCLDIAGARQDDGAPLIQYLCHGAANQRFSLQSVGDDDRYFIKAVHSGKCLGVNSFAKGSGLVQKSCESWGSVFKITEKSGDRYKIKEVVSGHCLEIPEKSYSPGRQLRIWNCNGNEEQRFRITD